jgi:hypothetical protein
LDALFLSEQFIYLGEKFNVTLSSEVTFTAALVSNNQLIVVANKAYASAALGRNHTAIYGQKVSD